jgi:hypothetical protein
MPIRIPVVLEISDEGAAALRDALDSLSSSDKPHLEEDNRPGVEIELPDKWKPLRTAHGIEYRWGEDVDVYDPFITYEGLTSKGKAVLAIGKCQRTRTHGRDRIYYIVINIGPEGGMRPIAEFLATDDYEDTGEVIAIIKGKEGTGRQFDTAEELPPIYRNWETVTYRDRVDYPSSYLKQGLVCSEDDFTTMLNHSLAQILLRNL